MAEEIGKGILAVGFDGKQVEEAGRQELLPSAQRLAKDIAGAFTAIKIAGFAKDGIEELKGAQVVSAQTAVQLRATGEAAGLTAKDIDDLGQSMLDLAGFDDEAARSAANVLLRFDQLKGVDLFKRIETDAADLAITMGTSLPAAAETLGRALQSPDKAARLLKPIIGALTEEQQKSIDAFVEQGDVAGAQGVILDALEAKIGGAAEAYGKTLPASIQRSSEEWKNAKAALVEGFAPALQTAADLSTDFAKAISESPEPVRQLVGGIVVLGGGVASLLGPISSLATTYGTLSARAARAAEATELLNVAETHNAVATNSAASVSGLYETKTKGMSAATKAFAGIVGVGAVVALAAYGDSLNKTALSAEELDRVTQSSAEDIAKVFDDLAKLESSEAFGGGFNKALDDLAAKGPAGLGVLTQLRDHYKAIGDDEHLGRVQERLDDAAKAEENLNKNLEIGTGSLHGNEEALAGVAAAAESFGGFIDNLAAAFDEAYESQHKFDLASLTNVDLVAAYEQSVDDLTGAIKENTYTLDLHEQAGRDNYAALRDTGTAIKDLIKMHFEETHSVEDAVGWGQKYVGNLKDQLEAAGYNEAQIAEMIDQINLTPEDIETTFTNNAVAQQIVVAEYVRSLSEDIPPEIRTNIRTLIDQGEYAQAEALLNELAADKTVDFTVQVHANGQITTTNRATGAVTVESDIAARNVPWKEQGGWVDGPRGTPVPIIAHGGEYVLSTDMIDNLVAGGGNVYNINVPAGVSDPYGYGMAVRRGIEDAVRSA